MHDNPKVTNVTRTMRTTPALCLGSTGNQRGTYRFFSLNTGRIFHRYEWTEMPFTPSIVDRVHHMADRDRQINGIEFRDRANRVMERVAPDAAGLLGSRHPPSLLDRSGILVSGRGPARDQPPTKGGSLDAITEEPEDTTAATGDVGSVADGGPADGWAAPAAPAAPAPQAAAAAPPPADGGNPAAPPLAAVEVVVKTLF